MTVEERPFRAALGAWNEHGLQPLWSSFLGGSTLSAASSAMPQQLPEDAPLGAGAYFNDFGSDLFFGE
jgi:hypothetical protein